MDSVV